MRACHLISHRQDPQISSAIRIVGMGVVFFTAARDRILSDVRRQMLTFMEGRHLRENSSQRAAPSVPLAVLFER